MQEFSTFMDGEDCPLCKDYEKKIEKLEKAIVEERMIALDDKVRVRELKLEIETFIKLIEEELKKDQKIENVSFRELCSDQKERFKEILTRYGDHGD